MATMNVSLPNQMKDWVEEKTRSGRYQTSSDLVRDLIRREQDREKAFAEMREFVQKGIDSGPAEPFDMEAFIARKRTERAKRRA